MAILWNSNPKILTDTYMIPYAVDIEIVKPVFTNKLSISKQTINRLESKQINVSLH